MLVWLKGRHQLKVGYRLVDRYPSPFIHDNTRSAINFNTSFVNNPLTNTGGTGLAEVLVGYFNSASRGFLLEPPTFHVMEQAAFLQDDFKVNNRFTINAGLRYEIFHAPTEKENRLANFDYQSFRLVYAGEDGVSRSAGKKTHYLNFAPRLGLSYRLTEDGRTVVRTGFGITYFPSPYAAGNLNHLNVPFVISQNVSHETNPLDFSRLRTIAESVPADCPGQTAHDGGPDCRQSPRLGHGFENETAYAEQWHWESSGSCFRRVVLELEYAGSAQKHMVLCFNPNEVQPGSGSQDSRRLLQPIASVSNMLQCDPRNQSTYHAGTMKFSSGSPMACRFSSATRTASRSTMAARRPAAAAPSVTARRSRTSRRGTVRRASTFGTARSSATSTSCPSATDDVGCAKPEDWLRAVVGGWQLSGITTMTTGRPFSVSLQTGVNNGAPSWPDRIGSGELDNPTVDLWFNPADFVAPLANTYGNAGRGILYGPGHVNFDTSLSKRFAVVGRSNLEFRWDAFNLFNHPGFGFPNSAIRQCRQPDASRPQSWTTAACSLR